jgi:hypothetical protein
MTVFLEKDNRWNKEPNVAITPEIGFEEFLNVVPEHANYDSLAVNMGAKLVA